jgi:hypothetical protein
MTSDQILQRWNRACDLLREALSGRLPPGRDLIEDGIPILVSELERLRSAAETRQPVLPVPDSGDASSQSEEARVVSLAEALSSIPCGRSKEVVIEKNWGDYAVTYTAKVGPR